MFSCGTINNDLSIFHRRCGGIFCSSCSEMSPWGECGAVRVCRRCRALRWRHSHQPITRSSHDHYIYPREMLLKSVPVQRSERSVLCAVQTSMGTILLMHRSMISWLFEEKPICLAELVMNLRHLNIKSIVQCQDAYRVSKNRRKNNLTLIHISRDLRFVLAQNIEHLCTGLYIQFLRDCTFAEKERVLVDSPQNMTEMRNVELSLEAKSSLLSVDRSRDYITVFVPWHISVTLLYTGCYGKVVWAEMGWFWTSKSSICSSISFI